MSALTATQARRRFLLLLGLRWLPVGLLIPVLVLLPLERGLTLAAVRARRRRPGHRGAGPGAADRRAVRRARPPAGAAAGRLLNLASLAVLAVADSVALFVVVYLLQGVYRALDSGPLEAWYVDHALAADPDADIETGLSRSGVVARAGHRRRRAGRRRLVALGPDRPGRRR